MSDDRLQSFYEHTYTTGDSERSGRWRQLGAIGKADHVEQLLADRRPRSVLEVGCGDGSVLSELARRGIGRRHTGVDISVEAIRLAGQRPEIDEAHPFDGVHLPAIPQEYDLAIATHVLEHVPDPGPLLADMTRVARTVIIEVPLEANLSARRPAAVQASQAVGHLHRFSRRDIRQLVSKAGWSVHGEVLDPLPLAVHAFDRRLTPRTVAKWAIRTGLASVPPVAERLITLHFAVLAEPRSRG